MSLENLISTFFGNRSIYNAVIKITKGDQYTPYFVQLSDEAAAMLRRMSRDFDLLNSELIQRGFGTIDLGSMFNTVGIKRPSPVRLG